MITQVDQVIGMLLRFFKAWTGPTGAEEEIPKVGGDLTKFQAWKTK